MPRSKVNVITCVRICISNHCCFVGMLHDKSRCCHAFAHTVIFHWASWFPFTLFWEMDCEAVASCDGMLAGGLLAELA